MIRVSVGEIYHSMLPVSSPHQIHYTAIAMAITRREFVQLNVSLALVSLCGRVCAGETEVPWLNDDKNVLSEVIYQLFPHPRLDKGVYEQVTQQVSDRVAQSAELTNMMKNAMESLTAEAGENGMAIPDREKEELPEKIQHTPFFQFVLNETLNGIYRHPLTWELLGFEGSSLEFGGYINRGFNDIDWLPE